MKAIAIRPGTYVEAITIEKDVTVRGDGPVEEVIVELADGRAVFAGHFVGEDLETRLAVGLGPVREQQVVVGLLGVGAVGGTKEILDRAIAYAKERVQSADLTQASDKTAPRVEIIRHPDVRRMLLLQKAHVEGMRALMLYTGWVQDQKKLHPEDEYLAKLDDLLLPLVTGYSS